MPLNWKRMRRRNVLILEMFYEMIKDDIQMAAGTHIQAKYVGSSFYSTGAKLQIMVQLKYTYLKSGVFSVMPELL